MADITLVGFDLSEDARVSFSVIDERGDEVRTLVDARDLEGDRKYRFPWDGRDDDGRPVPDGTYRLQVALRDEGRIRSSVKEVRVDTTPPRVRLSFAQAQPDLSRLRRVASAGGDRLQRPDATPRPSTGSSGPTAASRAWCCASAAASTKSAFWDGRLRGPLAPDGNYAFNVTVRDRAGNLARGPAGVAGPDCRHRPPWARASRSAGSRCAARSSRSARGRWRSSPSAPPPASA